jgi:hypothetical protein
VQPVGHRRGSRGRGTERAYDIETGTRFQKCQARKTRNFFAQQRVNVSAFHDVF